MRGFVLYIDRLQMNARARFWISGRVQGVFFRDHTMRWASSMGLSGWVRNLPDGRVEAVAEGEKDKIQKLESRLREGPPMSRVEDVRTEWEEYRGEFSSFRVI
jgi:acylphosphatase